MKKSNSTNCRPAKTIPEFGPGDTVIVNVKVVEGERTRVQAYEGVCIGRSGGGINESFTVRKISYGEGVERVFPLLSPMIDSIKVVRRGKVRRAKLYYLRDLRGKSARIVEKQDRADRRRRVIPPSAGMWRKARVLSRAFLLSAYLSRQCACQTIDCGRRGPCARNGMVPDRKSSLYASVVWMIAAACQAASSAGSRPRRRLRLRAA